MVATATVPGVCAISSTPVLHGVLGSKWVSSSQEKPLIPSKISLCVFALLHWKGKRQFDLEEYKASASTYVVYNGRIVGITQSLSVRPTLHLYQLF